MVYNIRHKVRHRTDDLETTVPTHGGMLFVTHRVDDLESPVLLAAQFVLVAHRSDDLESLRRDRQK